MDYDGAAGKGFHWKYDLAYTMCLGYCSVLGVEFAFLKNLFLLAESRDKQLSDRLY